MPANNQLASIQYVGIAGITEACIDAVQRMLQYNDEIVNVIILTNSSAHCLLFTVYETEKVAVKRGFTSGYSGEGPRGFARVLQLLLDHGVTIDEIDVDKSVLDRLDASALTSRDLEIIIATPSRRPNRFYDYIHAFDLALTSPGKQWSRFPVVIPFSIIDPRIADLALSFYKTPSDSLLQGFRRLEDVFRLRTGSEEYGAKLFAQSFQGENSFLEWKGIPTSETAGRVNLFTGAYMAHRNPRAHKEIKNNHSVLLSEFLLLNHLFLLEAAAETKQY